MLLKGKKSAGPVRWFLLLGLMAALLMPAGIVRAAEDVQPPAGSENARVRDHEPERDEPQEREGRRRRPPDEFIDRFRHEDDFRELIEVVRIWRMSRELDLSEGQALKLLMVSDKHRKAIWKMRQQQRQVIEELHKALDEGKDDSKIEELIGNVDEIDAQIAHAERDHRQKLFEGLSLEQKAKFYVFRPQFERDVRGTIRRIMESRRRADEEDEPEEDDERNRDRDRSRRE
jgi:hypothetical protein